MASLLKYFSYPFLPSISTATTLSLLTQKVANASHLVSCLQSPPVPFHPHVDPNIPIEPCSSGLRLSMQHSKPGERLTLPGPVLFHLWTWLVFFSFCPALPVRGNPAAFFQAHFNATSPLRSVLVLPPPLLGE